MGISTVRLVQQDTPAARFDQRRAHGGSSLATAAYEQHRCVEAISMIDRQGTHLVSRAQYVEDDDRRQLSSRPNVNA